MQLIISAREKERDTTLTPLVNPTNSNGRPQQYYNIIMNSSLWCTAYVIGDHKQQQPAPASRAAAVGWLPACLLSLSAGKAAPPPPLLVEKKKFIQLPLERSSQLNTLPPNQLRFNNSRVKFNAARCCCCSALLLPTTSYRTIRRAFVVVKCALDTDPVAIRFQSLCGR